MIKIWGLVLLTMASQVSSQEIRQELETRQLADSVFLISGKSVGSNVGVVIADNELLLVDTMLKKSTEELKAAIEKISNLPVTYIANTHGDFDHTGGNLSFQKMGAKVIGQKNITHSKVECDVCFEDSLEINLQGGIEVKFKSAVAHSFSDAVIFISSANVVFMGDILTNVTHATYYKGGLSGFEQALNYALSIGNDRTQYVAGHGRVLTKTELKKYLSAAKTLANVVIEKHRLGLPASEIVISETFKNAYDQMESERDFSATRMGRLERFVHRTISSERSANPTTEVSKYRGRYQWEGGDYFLLEVKGKKLLYKEEHRRIVELLAIDSNTFVGRGQLSGAYEFALSGGDKPVTMTYKRKGKPDYVAKKVAE